MREVTIVKKIFLFEELSADVQQVAIREHCNAFGYCRHEEAKDSLEKLAEHFDGKLTDWNFDWDGNSRSFAKFGMPDDLTRQEIAKRLLQLGDYDPKTLKGKGDCELTGYCSDEDAIDGFRQAFLCGEKDIDRLMQAAFQSWLKACQSDYADMQSVEQFTDHCAANEYEFEEDGSFYTGAKT